MHDLMPKKLISKKNIHNWAQYSTYINNYPFVNEYLGNTFQKWVREIDNPLEIEWIQQLFLSRLDHLNNNLQDMEREIEKENLISLLAEIKNQGGKAEAINEKILSIYGELHSFSEIKKLRDGNIIKTKEIGDWQTRSKIISVKSLTPIDQNYQIIETKIRGMHFIQEYPTLRKYNSIRLIKQSGMDYHFRSHILKFLNNSFIDSINFMNSIETTTLVYAHLYQPEFNTKGLQIGQSKIEVYRGITSTEEYILFMIQYNRQGESNQNHEITIKLSNFFNEQKVFFGVSNDTDTFFSENPIDLDKLKNQIAYQLSLLDNNFLKNNTGKEFIGWINIPIAPMHEEYVLNNISYIKETLSSIKNERLYKIIACLIPQFVFEMEEPILLHL